MPLDFSLLNAPQVDMLGNYQRGQQFSQQNAQNQMQQMELARGMQRKNRLADLLNSSGGDLQSLIEPLARGGYLTEAAAMQSIIQPKNVADWQKPGWAEAEQFKAGLKPEKQESTLAKIDPKDYTPQSVKSWFQGGMKDPSLLIAKSIEQKPSDLLARERLDWEKSGGKANAKPLPAAALKMQNEAVDAVGAMSSLNADLGTVKSNLESGALNLGMFSNLANKARNFGGLSTEESRNLATFQATLERLRNESLRLNKGVQTEGDAIRSWNEILANINDPELVKQRLDEVMRTNQRAVELRNLEVDNIRSNYGHDPLDLSGQQNVQPALTRTRGASGGWGKPAAKTQSGITTSGW